MKFLNILVLFFSTSLMSKELILKENQHHTLEENDVKRGNINGTFSEVYVITFDKLILHNKSVLFIPENLINKKVILNINELITFGSATIVQSFNNIFNEMFLLNFTEFEIFPTAGKGLNGASPGSNGGIGNTGRNSISKLTVNLNITKLDKLFIVLMAENGGKGGDGANGKQGQRPECDYSKDATNGGNGGQGGLGGSPGNTGDIEINWSSNKNLRLIGKNPAGLFVKSIPGISGFPGTSGIGGEGGEGRRTCLFGAIKRGGGSRGSDGPIIPINFIMGLKGKISITRKGEL